MSRRMLSNRYPKGPMMYQPPSNPEMSHQPTNSGVSYPYTSEASHYNTQQSSHNSGQHAWQQQYAVPPPQSQQLPPQQQQQEYWHGGTSFVMPDHAEKNAWNRSADSLAEINNSHHPATSTQRPVEQSYYQHNVQSQYEGPSMQQQQYQTLPLNNVYNNQSYVPGPPLTGTMTSANTLPQNNWYPPDGGDVKNQNCQQPIPDLQQMPWESVAPNISQAEHLPWTYNMPQNIPPPTQWPNPDTSTNYNSFPVNNTVQWSGQTTNEWPQKESVENAPVSQQNNIPASTQQSDYVDTSHQNQHIPVVDSESAQPLQLYSFQDNNVENLECNSAADNSLHSETGHSVNENISNEQDNGTVNTFFGNSVDENVEVSYEQSFPQAAQSNEPSVSHVEEKMSELQVLDASTSLPLESNIMNVKSVTQEFHQESKNFLQKEVDDKQLEMSSSSQLSSVEEPLNQEVPEPHDPVCLSSMSQDVASQVLDEPLNQQIPTANDISRSNESRKSSEKRPQEKIAISHREGSPFKPPPPKSSLTGAIVQKKNNNGDISAKASSNDDIGIQGVNLETFPDNLERPFDQDKPTKQYRSSRLRRYLQDDESLCTLDTSSTSLLDSPDIPCITLAPAAPLVSPASSHRTKSSTPPLDLLESELNDRLVRDGSSIPMHSEGIVSKVASSAHSQSDEKPANSHPVFPIILNQRYGSISSAVDPISGTSASHLLEKEQSKSSVKTADIERERDFKTSSPIRESKSSAPERQNFDHDNSRDSEIYSRSGKDFQASRSNRDQRDRYYERDRVPANRRDPRSFDKYADHSRQRYADNKYFSYDDRIYSDREGSRPSSRMSLNEMSENRTYRDYVYQKPYASDCERSPSRSSESETYRSDRQSYYDRRYQDPRYGQDDKYYDRIPERTSHRGYEYDQAAQNYYYWYQNMYNSNVYNSSSYDYGFHAELYRNDPRYRQQVDQRREEYIKYMRSLGYDVDYDRLSVPSGRSSANELTQQSYPERDGNSNDSEYSAFNQQPGDYSEDLQSTPSTRLTPAKFTYPHPIARFSNGQLILLMPNVHASDEHPALVEIHDVQVMTQELETYDELKSFQGPLIRGETHKNDVIDFCLRKIKFYKQKSGIADRESYILLWELLVLLLRQNGSVTGSDIAELLLKDHDILYPQLNRPAEDTPQCVQSPTDGGEHSVNTQTGDTSSPDEGIVVARDKTILNASRNVDVDKDVRKYREFLLFGHKKEALEWAMKHGLWSHALFLASKMDLRTYNSVLIRFTNSLSLNDPLQSLYQLMSGRQPAAVSCIADKQWGDWRPHLAMILSNPSSNPENDSRSITTLGDTLASQGYLPAAHFCYLMAQVEFGYYSRKSSKMVLLGADHLLKFDVFASNEAIQCTEIYEYAQSLANPGFMLNHLQAYKFLYATRLVDHGFLPEALRYCEVLASCFVAGPYSFSNDLITQVYELAHKLKYSDRHYLPYLNDLDQQEDPDWFKLFSTALHNLQNNVTFQSEGEEMPSDGLTENVKDEPNENVSQELLNSDVQNQNYYNQENQHYYQQETQNYYANNNAWTGNNSSTQNVHFDSNDNPSSQPALNQYTSSPPMTQWNLNAQTIPEQYEKSQTTEPVSSVPSPTSQISPKSSQSFSENKFDYGAGNQQEWSSALSLPSVTPNNSSRQSSHSTQLEDLEMLVRKEETESDTAFCSSSQSTPLHNYLMTSGDDDKQMLMSQHAADFDSHTLNSCLKSSRLRHCGKNKKCIKFDATVLNHSSNTREKTKFQQAVMQRRKIMTKKPASFSGTSDSSVEGSPSKEKKKNRSKLSIFASLGFGKGNEQNVAKTKCKRKSKRKNDTTEKILRSKKTFAIDEPYDAEQWTHNKSTVKESILETEQIISLLEKLSSEQQENKTLNRLIADEFKTKPPLIFGGTFPIDEPCEVAKQKKSYNALNSYPLTLMKSNVNHSNLIKTSVDKKRILETKKKENANEQQQVEMTTRSKTTFKMFRKLRSVDKNIIPGKTISSDLTSTKSSDKVCSKPKLPLLKAQAAYHRERTSSVGSVGFQRDRHDSNISSGSDYAIGSPTTMKRKSSDDRKPDTKEDKSRQQVGRSWLGGMFERLLPKHPNQMILPDDKNPTIVWDSVKKSWYNKDSTETEENAQPASPPTDVELMRTGGMLVSTSMPSVTPAPSSAGNKFQRPKIRGMRGNYVDVLNPSNTTTKTSMLPDALCPPPSLPPQQKLFVPSGPAADDTPMDFVSSGQPHLQSSQADDEDGSAPPPMFINPAEFDSRRSSIASQRHSVGPARRTYPT